VFLVLHREEGQGLAEYGIILSLIMVVAVIALLFIGGVVTNMLSAVGKAL